MVSLTLIGRSYCHLCEDMQVAIAELTRAHGAELSLEVVDLDAHPALEDRFGELIPVLLAGSGVDGDEICHHFLDVAALEALLAPQGALSTAKT